MVVACVTKHKEKRELSRKNHKKVVTIYILYITFEDRERGEKIEVRSEEV